MSDNKKIKHSLTRIYGLKSCDTIKKAQKWLQVNDIEFEFHDYRKDGLSKQWLNSALTQLGWELVLNKRGTTYRQLDDSVKESVSADNVAELLIEYPAMIKRPILEFNGQLFIGFKPDQYQQIFA